MVKVEDKGYKKQKTQMEKKKDLLFYNDVLDSIQQNFNRFADTIP